MSRDGANYKECTCHRNYNNCKCIVFLILNLKKYSLDVLLNVLNQETEYIELIDYIVLNANVQGITVKLIYNQFNSSVAKYFHPKGDVE